MTARVRRALLAGGAAGAVLFVVVFLAESLLHPAGYQPLRHTVSAFVLGPYGWVQRTNFVVSGLLIASAAVGLRPAWARLGGGRLLPILVGLLGLGLVGAGGFAADPIAAGATVAAPYPPGVPLRSDRTITGVLHDLAGVPMFLGLPVLAAMAAFRLGKLGRRPEAAYALATALGFLALFVLTSLALDPGTAFPPVGGLLQRLTLIVGLGWLAAFLLRIRPPR